MLPRQQVRQWYGLFLHIVDCMVMFKQSFHSLYALNSVMTYLLGAPMNLLLVETLLKLLESCAKILMNMQHITLCPCNIGIHLFDHLVLVNMPF
jgi:hypothetical protein